MLFHLEKLTPKARAARRIVIGIVCLYAVIQIPLGIAINVVEDEIVRSLQVMDQNAITSGYVSEMPETYPSGDYVYPMPKRNFPKDYWSMVNIPHAHMSAWVGSTWHNLQWLREQRDDIQSLSISLSQYSEDRMWLLGEGCQDW